MPPTLTDYLSVALAALALGIGIYHYTRRQSGVREAELLLAAYGWKLLAWALGLAVLAQQYAWHGDSVGAYYTWAIKIRAFLADKPSASFAYLLGSNGWYETLCMPTAYVESKSVSQMLRLSWILSYAAAGRYLWMSFLGALLAFGASWYLFSRSRRYLAGQEIALGLAIFCWPTQVYWANGLTKETFVLLGLSLFLIGFYRVLGQGQRSFRALLGLGLGAYFLVTVKVYVFLLLLPALAAALLAQHWKQLAANRMALALWGGTIALVIGLLYLGLGFAYPKFGYAEIGTNLAQQLVYISDSAETRANSAFLLPPIRFELGSLLWHYPLLLITGLFRPFAWEAQSPLELLASAETLLLLSATLYIGFRLGLRTVFRRILSDPLLLGIVVFCLLFFAAIPLGSNNFGTLVRYKQPALLGYVYLLVALATPFKRAATV